MKSESAELVSGLIRQYRRLRLLYLGYLAAAVLALVFFFVDKRVTLALVAASLVYHLVVVRRAGKAYQRAWCGRAAPVPTTAAVCAWVTPGLPIPSPWRGKPTTSSWWAPG